MAKFKVIFIESYEHVILLDANSYLEAGEKADQILSKDNTTYCDKEPNWFLHSVEKALAEKKSRKELCCSA